MLANDLEISRSIILQILGFYENLVPYLGEEYDFLRNIIEQRIARACGKKSNEDGVINLFGEGLVQQLIVESLENLLKRESDSKSMLRLRLQVSQVRKDADKIKSMLVQKNQMDLPEFENIISNLLKSVKEALDKEDFSEYRKVFPNTEEPSRFEDFRLRLRRIREATAARNKNDSIDFENRTSSNTIFDGSRIDNISPSTSFIQVESNSFRHSRNNVELGNSQRSSSSSQHHDGALTTDELHDNSTSLVKESRLLEKYGREKRELDKENDKLSGENLDLRTKNKRLEMQLEDIKSDYETIKHKHETQTFQSNMTIDQLTTKVAALQKAEAEFKSKLGTLESFRKLHNDLEDRLNKLAKTMNEKDSVIREKEKAVFAAQEHTNTLKSQLNDSTKREAILKEELRRISAESSTRTDEHQATLRKLQQSMDNQAKLSEESSNVRLEMDDLIEKCSRLQSDLIEQSSKYEALQLELEQVLRSRNDAEFKASTEESVRIKQQEEIGILHNRIRFLSETVTRLEVQEHESLERVSILSCENEKLEADLRQKQGHIEHVTKTAKDTNELLLKQQQERASEYQILNEAKNRLEAKASDLERILQQMTQQRDSLLVRNSELQMTVEEKSTRDENERERLKALEHEVDGLRSTNTQLNSNLKQLKEDLEKRHFVIETLNSEVDLHKMEISNLEERLVESRSVQDSANASIKRYQLEVTTLKDELRQANDTTASLNSKYKTLQESMNTQALSAERASVAESFLRTQLEESQTEIESLTLAKNDLEIQNHELISRLQGTETQLATQTHDLEVTRKRIHTLEQQTNTYAQESVNTQSLLNELAAVKESLHVSETSRKQYENLIATLPKAEVVVDLEAKIVELSDSLRSARSFTAQQEAIMSTLKVEQLDALTERDSLAESLHTLRATCESLQNQLQSAQNQLAQAPSYEQVLEYEATIAKLSSSLQSNVAENETKLNNLSRRESEASATNESLLRELELSKAEITRLQAALKETQGHLQKAPTRRSIEEFEEKLEQLFKEHDDTLEELLKARSENDQLEAKLLETKNVLASAPSAETIENYENEIQGLKSALQSQKLKIDEQSRDIARLSQTRMEADSTNENLIAELNSAKSEIDHLKVSLVAAQRQLEGTTSNADLAVIEARAESEMSRLTTLLTEAEKQLEETISREDLAVIESKAESEINRLKGLLADTTRQLEDTMPRKDAYANEEKLQEVIHQLNERIDEMEGANKLSETVIASLTEDLQLEQEQCATMKAQLRNFQIKFENTESSLTGSKNEQAELKQELASLRNEVYQLKAQLQEREKRIASISQEHETTLSDMNMLREESIHLKTLCTEHEKQLSSETSKMSEDSSRMILELQQKYEDILEEKETISKQFFEAESSRTEEVHQIKDELAKTQQALGDADKENQNLHARLSQATENCSNLETELSQMRLKQNQFPSDGNVHCDNCKCHELISTLHKEKQFLVNALHRVLKPSQTM